MKRQIMKGGWLVKSEVVDALLRTNERFYRDQARHFSDTRSSAWKGWERCVAFVERAAGIETLEDDGRTGGLGLSCRLLDVACGNMRFEAFLHKSLPHANLDVVAVDNCPQLSVEFAYEFADGDGVDVSFFSMDVISALRTDGARPGPGFLSFGRLSDMAVAFGFMHHIPTMQLRCRLLEELVASVRSGGFIAVSFWEFMSNEDMARKTQAVHARALDDLALAWSDLEENDFIIGWNNVPGAYRYCHSFTSLEIDELLDSVKGRARVIDRFFADGRTNNLNEYVVLQVL